MPPRTIGPYRVLETLGSGGVGTVYRAIDRRTGEHTALKLLSTGPALDPRAARRLAREFETLYELSHPNVVKVFDTGVFHGYPYLAMELVEGLNLRQYLSLTAEELGSSSSRSVQRTYDGDRSPLALSAEPASDGDRPFDLRRYGLEAPSVELDLTTGPASLRALADLADEPDTFNSTVDASADLPPVAATSADPPERPAPVSLDLLNRPERVGRLVDAMMQLCQALAYIHGHGVVHRDLKPSNVMVDEERVVRLMDFGLAKFLADDAAVTANGRMVGTFRYMAPEQILGETLDGRADLYSLGVILYELLSGRPPFDAKTPYELWQKALETEPTWLSTLNPDADHQLVRLAHRLIRKEPDERFRTAEEVSEALSEL
ncbi:MAG TPA: serine/threonine-protein kinase [Myxococcaceae bacterium]|nr:serine/threonine-protein kinase [Myxococcaceae bacterium]